MIALLVLVPLLVAAAGTGLSPRRQPNARVPNRHDELRALEWGDLNFLHTTDTHGWLAGHILEKQFSGDWGDFVSFTTHMRALADARGKDLLIIDTGDRHDGNGLSDATEVNGELSQPIFCEVDFDVVTVGNHELYTGIASLQEFHSIRHHFQDRYVVSNVEVFDDSEWKPLGSKYRVFETKNLKKRVLAFGFLFNFDGNDKQITRVTKVEHEIEKQWFQDVLRDILPTVDYIVLAGHIPVRDWPEFQTILDAIREKHSTIPVSMFGGHSHVRDYVVYDDNAVALQSGRYVETIGFASVNLTENGPEFSRAYIDFNQRTMAFHSGAASIAEFVTDRGRNLSEYIARTRQQLDLDDYQTYIPQTYYMDRAPYPSERSVYTLFEENILPLLTSPPELVAKQQTRFVFLNTGALRFDMFKGPYTKDSTFILSPFRNKWFYIADIPLETAEKVLPILNGQGRVLQANSRFMGALYLNEMEQEEVVEQQGDGYIGSRRPSFGYVTEDDEGDQGDDTVHRAWRFYDVPNAIVSVQRKSTENATLVFHGFMTWYIEQALAQLTSLPYEILPHGGEDITELVPLYFQN